MSAHHKDRGVVWRRRLTVRPPAPTPSHGIALRLFATQAMANAARAQLADAIMEFLEGTEDDVAETERSPMSVALHAFNWLVDGLPKRKFRQLVRWAASLGNRDFELVEKGRGAAAAVAAATTPPPAGVPALEAYLASTLFVVVQIFLHYLLPRAPELRDAPISPFFCSPMLLSKCISAGGQQAGALCLASTLGEGVEDASEARSSFYNLAKDGSKEELLIVAVFLCVTKLISSGSGDRAIDRRVKGAAKHPCGHAAGASGFASLVGQVDMQSDADLHVRVNGCRPGRFVYPSTRTERRGGTAPPAHPVALLAEVEELQRAYRNLFASAPLMCEVARADFAPGILLEHVLYGEDTAPRRRVVAAAVPDDDDDDTSSCWSYDGSGDGDDENGNEFVAAFLHGMTASDPEPDTYVPAGLSIANEDERQKLLALRAAGEGALLPSDRPRHRPPVFAGSKRRRSRSASPPLPHKRQRLPSPSHPSGGADEESDSSSEIAGF